MDLDRLTALLQSLDAAQLLAAAQRLKWGDPGAPARALLIEAVLQEQVSGHWGEPDAGQFVGSAGKGSTPRSGASPAARDARTQLAALDLPAEYTPGRQPPGLERSPDLVAYSLGSFRLWRNLRAITYWPSRKGLAILEYLILQHPTPVPKEVLMDVFWPEAEAEAARRNLHQAIYSVRQVLKKHGLGPLSLQFGQDDYFLDPRLGLWSDVAEFEKHVTAGRRLEALGRRETAMAEYGIAQGLYQGDLLEDELYDDWPRWQREMLRNTYLDITDRLGEHSFQQHDYPGAMALSWKILTFDHCHEQAHGRLIKCYMAQGQRHMAVRQYHLCAAALQAELNLAPSPETMALYRQIVTEP